VKRVRPLVVAANWKMHKSTGDVDPYFAAFERATPGAAETAEAGVEILFFPPFPILERVVRRIESRAATEAGAQMCHWEAEGAFTGEVSAPMVAATGATRVLVGHSERRQLFGETDETCGRRIRAGARRDRAVRSRGNVRDGSWKRSSDPGCGHSDRGGRTTYMPG